MLCRRCQSPPAGPPESRCKCESRIIPGQARIEPACVVVSYSHGPSTVAGHKHLVGGWVGRQATTSKHVLLLASHALLLVLLLRSPYSRQHCQAYYNAPHIPLTPCVSRRQRQKAPHYAPFGGVGSRPSMRCVLYQDFTSFRGCPAAIHAHCALQGISTGQLNHNHHTTTERR